MKYHCFFLPLPEMEKWQAVELVVEAEKTLADDLKMWRTWRETRWQHR